jgi:hypothetical protein
VSFCSGISAPLRTSGATRGAKFRKPANGSSLSTAHATPKALARLDAELSSKSRSVISITVEVYDELGAHTLSAKFEWFIQREKRI